MKISRKRLESIVREEFIKHVQRLQEAPTASVEDAETDNKDKEKAPETKKDDGGEKNAAPDQKTKPADKADNTKPEEQGEDTPGEEDHESDDLQQGHDAEAGDEEEDADEVTGGEIAKEIQGKTVQSITMDPKSKIMPGAQEIVVTFDQIPDPLRILIGKTGSVKFYFRGLHNEL